VLLRLGVHPTIWIPIVCYKVPAPDSGEVALQIIEGVLLMSWMKGSSLIV
jgi:hypothetical protein